MNTLFKIDVSGGEAQPIATSDDGRYRFKEDIESPVFDFLDGDMLRVSKSKNTEKPHYFGVAIDGRFVDITRCVRAMECYFAPDIFWNKKEFPLLVIAQCIEVGLSDHLTESAKKAFSKPDTDTREARYCLVLYDSLHLGLLFKTWHHDLRNFVKCPWVDIKLMMAELSRRVSLSQFCRALAAHKK